LGVGTSFKEEDPVKEKKTAERRARRRQFKPKLT
jgi:hypothetical protein